MKYIILTSVMLLYIYSVYAQTKDTTKAVSLMSLLSGVNNNMPQFPGGDKALKYFLDKNIQYPPYAMEHNIHGKVLVLFIINIDGTISDIAIKKDIGGGCADEVVRIIKLMPKWMPSIQKGKPVRVYYPLPIRFRLPNK